MKTDAKNQVVMGRIVAPYGVYGWIKVLPDTEEIDGLFDYPTWWVGKDNEWREFTVETAKIHNDVLVVKLIGIDDRDAAIACKGKQVAVPRESLPSPEENEYYWSDLIGLSVKNQQNIDFGMVVDVLETGANDVLVVKASKENGALKDGIERLIPFVDQVVLEVDIQAKTMLVDWDADF